MLAKFRQRQWMRKRRMQLYIGSNELKTNFNKFKGSIFAIIFGLIIGSIVIGASGHSIFTYLHYVIWYAFSSYPVNNWDTTLVWWSVYITAGLALVLSFKTGLFNIGVAGQMTAAGSVIMVIGIRYNFSQPVTLILALILAVLVSMLVAGLIAFLKVMFNIHEVVTSILLNWIILYLVKWIFVTSNDLYDGSSVSTKPLNDHMSLAIGGYKFILPLILAISLIFVVWFLLKSTTLGYKLKTVGLNPFAAKYSGMSRRRYSFMAFILSGAVVGVMAFIYYIGVNPAMTFSSDTLPAIGFDSISVALVGQINAWGVAGAAILYAIIKSGGPIGSVGLSLPNAVGDIIFGVIIYSAACAVLLARFQPIKLIISYWTVGSKYDSRQKFKKLWLAIWTNIFAIPRTKRQYHHKIKDIKLQSKQTTNQLQQTDDLNAAIAAVSKAQIEAINLLKANARQAHQDLQQFVTQTYQAIWFNGMTGISHAGFESKKRIFGEKLNDYITAKNEHDELLHHLKQQYKVDIKALKSVKTNNYWVENGKINQQLKTKITTLNHKFNLQFQTLLQTETSEINKINKVVRQSKGAYLKDKEKSKQEITKIKREHHRLIKTLKQQNQLADIKKHKLELQQKIAEIQLKIKTKKYFNTIKGEQ